MNDSQQMQINELKKLDYKFYEFLANGQEPLTYTYGEAKDSKCTQVEVNARYPKKSKGILVYIDFDTDWSGRWIKTAKAQVYFITPSNKWFESSYDGSEFAE